MTEHRLDKAIAISINRRLKPPLPVALSSFRLSPLLSLGPCSSHHWG